MKTDSASRGAWRRFFHHRYCVTVMDNWTPLRMFWRRKSAVKFWNKHKPASHFFVWSENEQWVEAKP